LNRNNGSIPLLAGAARQDPRQFRLDLQAASGINDRGQIDGVGLINGEEHAFLLTPKS